ncbi:MAG: TRAP transporter small permease subunit [Candidatus Anammoxibacter sp.]
MKLLQHYIRFIDNLNDKIGSLTSWLTAIMVVVVCYDVFTRYILQKSSVAVQELQWHLFAAIFLIAAAYTFRHDKHVRVDILYARFSPKVKAWVNLSGCIIFLIPFAVLIMWTSRDFVANSFIIREISPDPGGLPARYILKALIPIGFFLLFLQAFSVAFKSLLTILSNDQRPKTKD